MLFSDPTGSGLEGTPQVLVQGTADVDDRDLDANRDALQARDRREAARRPRSQMPPKAFERLLDLVPHAHLHPRAPRAHLRLGRRRPGARARAVRRAHGGGPLRARRGARSAHAPAQGGAARLGRPHGGARRALPEAVVSLVAPDGFPFSVRLPVEVDRAARRVRLGGAPVGVPWQPGLACVAAHDHSPDFTWQRNFQVRGDLVEEDGAWAVVPRKLLGRLRAAARRGARARAAEHEEDAPLPQDRQARAGGRGGADARQAGQ